MACMICGSHNNVSTVFTYDEPDKYETAMGITRVSRKWCECNSCGIFRQYRNYKLELLNPIYKKIYRSKEFRGETIENAFNRIVGKTDECSENNERVQWLKNALPMTEGTMLDIGSGIGVFPYAMSDEWDVTCVEENEDSVLFINSINIPCLEEITNEAYDLVTLVHVLEHIEDLHGFLFKIKEHCNEFLFIEVPDAEMFVFNNKHHDDFNACHEWFFTLPTLIRLLEGNGFSVMDATRRFYSERGLSRLLVLAQCS